MNEVVNNVINGLNKKQLKELMMQLSTNDGVKEIKEKISDKSFYLENIPILLSDCVGYLKKSFDVEDTSAVPILIGKIVLLLECGIDVEDVMHNIDIIKYFKEKEESLPSSSLLKSRSKRIANALDRAYKNSLYFKGERSTFGKLLSYEESELEFRIATVRNIGEKSSEILFNDIHIAREIDDYINGSVDNKNIFLKVKKIKDK